MTADHSMFTTKTPHFFKVILPGTLRDGKLGIPRNFVRKYASRLPSQVHLEVPNGEIWEVELTKSDEMVWLQKGWPQFAELYSIKAGHFLVFRYEGNARFHVLIFDITAAEINYPYTKIRAEDDDIIILDNMSMLKKTREKPYMPNPQPKKKKKMKDDSPNETGIKHQNDAIKRDRTLTALEKANCLKKAEGFQTKNPFFKMVMQPSFVIPPYKMFIPSSFARKYMQMSHGNMILSLSTGETWHSSYYYCSNKPTPLVRDWRGFAEHSALEVGDVCVFELTQMSPEISFKIFVYPAGEDKNTSERLGTTAVSKKRGVNPPIQCPLSQKMKIEPDMTNVREKSPNSEYLAPSYRGSRIKIDLGASSSCSKQVIKPAKGIGSGKENVQEIQEQSEILRYQKAKSRQIANTFNSRDPFFFGVIQPSHLARLKAYMCIPMKFVRKFLTMKNGDNATLYVNDEKSWSVSVKYYLRLGKGKALFRVGWNKFAEDNNLMVGDICVFKLLNGAEMSFKVVIHRLADDANIHPSTFLMVDCGL